MESDVYYVRSRGKISGPFDISSLQKLARRGALSRMHELSPDRTNWAHAGDYVDLFPARYPTAIADAQPTNVPEAHSASPSIERYFYVQNGVTVGPVPLGVLASLAQNGTLRPSDICWQENASVAVAASQLPALAAILSATGNLSGDRATNVTPAARTTARHAVNDSHSFAQLIGIIAGSVFLLFLNLPIGLLHDKTVWWWNSLHDSNGGSLSILCFFILFAGLAVIPVGIFCRGFVRGWIFFGTSAISLILFYVSFQNQAPGEFCLSLLIFYITAALIGASSFRSVCPGSTAGKIFQAVFGGALILAILILAIVNLSETSGMKGVWGSSDQLPGWAMIVISLLILETVAGVVAGILSLVGLRQTFSRPVTTSARWFAIGSLLSPFLAVFIWVCAMVNIEDMDQKPAVIFLTFRVLLIFGCFLWLMTAGLLEIFVTSHAAPMVNSNTR